MGPRIKYGLRTCAHADWQRYNLQTVNADHSIKCRPQFADQMGVEVLNDGPFFMCNAPA